MGRLAFPCHLIVYVIITLSISCVLGLGPFRWMQLDNFDEIYAKMNKATQENCQQMSDSDLRLPPTTLNEIPRFNQIPLQVWYRNRTRLLHMHNMAMNRATFFSFILQRLNSSKVDFPLLPGFSYYYFSTSADVSANPAGINGSAVLMDTNCTYANWYTNLDFNITLPLFGPKAYRLDDWNDEMNWLREPTNNTIQVTDLGAGSDHNYTAPWYKNNPYMADKDMQISFLPDDMAATGKKHQYDTRVRLAMPDGTPIKTPDERSFFGPPSPGVKEDFQPVRFTRPYFDCGRTNRWLVSAVAPVVDYMYRYSEWTRLRGAKIIGLVTMDIDFLRIDFNPCPVSQGNPIHYFAGVARCKLSTTMCEPLPGFGFYRGGYQCVCLPGYRLPYNQNGPFRGIDIEVATEQEYRNGFDCLPIGWRQVLPQEKGIKENLERKRRSVENAWQWIKGMGIQASNVVSKLWTQTTSKANGNGKLVANQEQLDVAPDNHLVSKQSFVELLTETSQSRVKPNNNRKTNDTLRYGPPRRLVSRQQPSPANSQPTENKPSQRVVSRQKRNVIDYLGRLSVFDEAQFTKVRDLLDRMQLITTANCASRTNDELTFPGEVGYGSEIQFEMQARTALRLAHFLSAYYQNDIRGEVYGNLKASDGLNRFQLFGEVFANVMGDAKLFASGIFFDRQRYQDNVTRWELFAPYAYKPGGSTQAFEAIDMSVVDFRGYTELPWFKHLKERWASNTYGLERFVDKPWIRSDLNGSQLQRYYNYPLYFRAPRYEDGYWTQPYFDCRGFVKDWVITYSAPFFGTPDNSPTLLFMGVVTATVRLMDLDTNQCPGSFYTPNFFKNTARCDFRTTFCTPIPGRAFRWGSYKCECRQGFEYPFNDLVWYFEGQTMEEEYKKKLSGITNRFDILRCREGGAAAIGRNGLLLLLAVLASFTFTRYY